MSVKFKVKVKKNHREIVKKPQTLKKQKKLQFDNFGQT